MACVLRDEAVLTCRDVFSIRPDAEGIYIDKTCPNQAKTAAPASYGDL